MNPTELLLKLKRDEISIHNAVSHKFPRNTPISELLPLILHLETLGYTLALDVFDKKSPWEIAVI